VTNGASNRVQQVFSPGEQVLTKTGKRFEIEEIGAERIRFRLLASGRRMSLKQSRLARVIENFKEIRNSDNLERAVNDVLRKFGESDSTNEPYLYGLAQEFLKRQPTGRNGKQNLSPNPKAAKPKVRSKPHVDPAQFDFSQRSAEMVRIAQKLEAALVRDYKEWLKKRGHVVSQLVYGRLLCDAHEKDRNNLIEAKSSIRREFIRMAVGQLLDYAFLGKEEFGTPHMAILLPKKPESKIRTWLEALRIKVIWKQRKAFVDNAQGRFT
jgi:hypothetical protein